MVDRSNAGQWMVCPACHQRAGMATGSSATSYECEQCGHLWNESGDTADRPRSANDRQRNPRSNRRSFD